MSDFKSGNKTIYTIVMSITLWVQFSEKRSKGRAKMEAETSRPTDDFTARNLLQKFSGTDRSPPTYLPNR